jgi:O-antigen/teichoic acid export membrane protein
MFVFAYMLLGFNGDRLMAYGAFMTVTPSVISIIQMLRARCAFEGCVVRPKYLFSKSHLKPMFAYAFGDLFGSLGAVVRDNGTAFLINVNFGPAMNASFGIANQVSNHTTALSSAMIGALVPAVTTAEGSGDHAHALRLAFRSIKFGVALILVFCIPLILEMDEVLKLWLVNPPEGTAILCRCMLFAFICHKLGWGHQLVILAKGRVVGAQLILGTTSALGLLLSWVLIKNGYGMLAIGISYIVIYSLMTLERAICAKKLCAMPLRYWMFRIILPLTAVGGVSYLVGTIEISLVAPSFTRIIFTSIVTNLVIGIGLMFFVFDQDERNYFKNLMRKMKGT